MLQTRLVLFGLLLCSVLVAQTPAPSVKVGPKQPTPPVSAPGAETEHMIQLVTQLKLDVAKIRDPLARKAEMDNVDLWQHMLDHIAHENHASNNTGAEHHHDHDATTITKPNTPKP